MAEKTIVKIFIASAGEVKAEREKAILVLHHLNESHKHLELKPVEWEYAMVKGNFPGHETIQDAINPKLSESDLVVFIFYSCIRPNTLTEFIYATKGGKQIFTYFKNGFSPSKETFQAFGELLDFKAGLSSTILKIQYEDTESFGDLFYINLNQYLSEKYPASDTSAANETVAVLSKANQMQIQLLVDKEKEIKELKDKLALKYDNQSEDELQKLVAEKEAIKKELLQNEEVIKQQEQEKQELQRQLALYKGNDELKVKALEQVEKGNYAEAEEFLKESAKSSIDETASTFYELAKIKKLQFNYADALGYYELATKIKPGDSLYLNEAGIVADNLGLYNKAIEYYDKALAIDIKNGEKENPNIAIRYNNLGASYNNKGEYDKAIEYYEKALLIDKENNKEEYANLATRYNNLGLVYNNKGAYDTAIDYYEKAVAIDKKFYGEEYPGTAIRYNNLGLAYDNKGEYDKAIEYYDKALAIDKKFHGEEHPNIAIRYSNLGSVFNNKGEYDKAIEYYDKALAIDKKFHGEEHPNIAIRYNNMGLAYDNKGEYDKAIEYYQKALVIDKKFLGEAHPSIAIRYSNLASAFNSKSEYDKAIGYYEKSLAIDNKFHSEEYPFIAIRMSSLALVYKNRGNYDKAIEFYEKALALDLKYRSGNYHKIAIRYNSLGLAYDSNGMYDKAIANYEQSLSAFRKCLKADDPNIQTVEKNLAAAKDSLAGQK